MVYGFEKDTVEQYNFDEDVSVRIYENFSYVFSNCGKKCMKLLKCHHNGLYYNAFDK